MAETADESADLSDEDDEESESSHFEKYVMRATNSVDKILSLDRLRQEVALRELAVRNPTLTPSGGSSTDLMSIISKRNKSGRALSVFSVNVVSTSGTSVYGLLRSP